MSRFVTLLATTAVVANAHTFISVWGPKGGNLEKAQKTDLGSSSYRQGSDNTGWIGAKFLETAAIACSASNTPFGQVAAPGGTFFSSSDQSPGKDLTVAAGSTIQLVTSGNPGEGFPHPNGHIQAYMGDCGGSCDGVDVTQIEFFKILEDLNGIQNHLRPAMDQSVNGNRYDVTIPKNVPAGNYIFRFELIAFGQSSPAEGQQDQYYPSCGNLIVTGGGKRDLEERAAFKRATQGQLVKFPGAYQNGNIDQSGAPGPSVISGSVPTGSGGSSSSGSGSGSSSSGSGSGSGSSTTGGSSSSSGSGSSSSGSGSGSSSSSGGSGSGSAGAATGGSSTLTLPSSAGACAAMCLQIKISERTSLGASCDASNGACMCAAPHFMEAYDNCLWDNCGDEAVDAKAALESVCSGLSSGNQAVSTGGSGSSSSGSHSSGSGSCKSKRSRSTDRHLAAGKSKRLHRINKRRITHPVAVALRAETH